jgi:hypothetical protein
MTSEIIIAFITGILIPITILILKNYFNKSKTKTDMVKDTLRVSELVMMKLERLLEDYDADRVWITQFHNGGNFYPTGKSMAKFSILYESVSIGVTSIQTNFRNVPVNLFSKSINRLLEYDCIEISDYTDETIVTYGLKSIAEITDCKSGYLFAIKTIDGKFIGTLGIDYTKEKIKLDTESVKYLLNQSSLLGGVLMSHLSEK